VVDRGISSGYAFHLPFEYRDGYPNTTISLAHDGVIIRHCPGTHRDRVARTAIPPLDAIVATGWKTYPLMTSWTHRDRIQPGFRRSGFERLHRQHSRIGTILFLQYVQIITICIFSRCECGTTRR